MIEKYLEHMEKYSGYFYEMIPHVMNRKKTWEFYLKKEEKLWSIGIEANGNNQKFNFKEIIPYCQKENIDLLVLEQHLMQSMITKGMYYKSKEMESCQEYQDLLKLVPETYFIEALENMKKMCEEIVGIVKKPKLSMVKD